MRTLLCFLYIFPLFSCSQQKNVTPKQYIDRVFEIIEKNSIRKDSVDFKNLKAHIFSKVEKTTSLEYCYPLVDSILTALGDRHSSFVSKEDFVVWSSANLTKASDKLITFNGKLLESDIGYLQLQGFDSGDSVSIIAYADSLQKLIKSIDHKSIKGWIIDIRENMGGNCWPMLSGLGPILGDGVCGYFVNADNVKSSWYYKNGAAGESDLDSITATRLSIPPYHLLNSNVPIAILTGPNTASSGEIVAISFRERPNTRSFGQNTYGVSTSNETFILPDSSAIFLTIAIDADRNGKLFGKEVVPDVIIGPNNRMLSADNTIFAAVNWISKY